MPGGPDAFAVDRVDPLIRAPEGLVVLYCRDGQERVVPIEKYTLGRAKIARAMGVTDVNLAGMALRFDENGVPERTD
jgi:hypothetical protein